MEVERKVKSKGPKMDVIILQIKAGWLKHVTFFFFLFFLMAESEVS